MPDKNIICPQCGAEFSVAESVEKMMADELDQQSKNLQARADAELKQRLDRIERENEAHYQRLESDKKAEIENRDRKNQEKLLEAQRREEAAKEGIKRIQAESDAILARKERELETERANLAAKAERDRLEAEKKMRAEQARLESDLRLKLDNEALLKQKEQSETVLSMSRKVAELERQLQQANQQLQGEAQEVALEEILQMAFPSDIIEAVPKGCRGADCVQKIRTNGEVLGTIVWESKRTKQWANDWIGKLKDDQRTLTAEIAILVTQAFPADMKNKTGNIDGVWITDFQSSMGIALALRAGLIEVSRMKTMSSGTDDKTQMVFDYITSAEFRQSVQAIAETFIAFQQDIASEKRAMEKQWKRREMTIVRALKATTRLHGSLQTILGQGVLPDIDESGAKQLTT